MFANFAPIQGGTFSRADFRSPHSRGAPPRRPWRQILGPPTAGIIGCPKTLNFANRPNQRALFRPNQVLGPAAEPSLVTETLVPIRDDNYCHQELARIVFKWTIDGPRSSRVRLRLFVFCVRVWCVCSSLLFLSFSGSGN